MIIDIIDYTSEQYSFLTVQQLTEVRSAQDKKNKLQAKLNEDLKAMRADLVQKGIFLSSILETETARLTSAYEAQVEALRESLLFYLRYYNDSPTTPEVSEGYVPDYRLSDEERYYQVRDYYLATYQDDLERFEAFKKDEVAANYLTQYYGTLYDYFRIMAEQ